MSIPGQRTPSADQLNGSRAPIPGDVDVAMKDLSTKDLPTPSVSDPASPKETPELSDGKPTPLTESIRRQAAALRNSLAFTQVVGVLMRSPHYRQYTLADLEWLVIPSLSAGQFRIGEVKPDKNQGAAMPVAVVLWASVSEEIDKRLMEADSASFRLKPEEWKSGDILWLVHAAGETRFVKHVVEQLTKTTLKGRQVKVLGRDKDGKSKVHLLESSAEA
jgi:cytolysin-activating lysine-acyltransferase